MTGSGGSILMVPLLVYLFSISPMTATSYSLFIVGTASLVGAASNLSKGFVDLRAVGQFGLSSFLTLFFTRRFLIPAIPEELFQIGETTVRFSLLLMVFFAGCMALAAASMIRSGSANAKEQSTLSQKGALHLILYGIGMGLVTGFLGIGGGFLLVPALVFLLKLPVRKAVGTSLMIISFNSFTGFLGDAGQYPLNWGLAITLAGIAVAGTTLGGKLNRKLPEDKIKRGFGWFVLGVSVCVLGKEIFLW